MPFLDHVFLSNSIRSWLLVAAIILLMCVFKRYISRYLSAISFRLASRFMPNLNRQQYINLVAEPMGWFIVIVVSVFALDKLNYPRALEFAVYGHTVSDILSRLGSGIMIVTFVWLLLRIIDFIAQVLEQKADLTPDTRDNQLIVFFRDFLKVLIGIVGILWIIKACFHQPIGHVLTGLSIVGAALALAAKESLENLIASFIIFFDKPFFTGDVVKTNAVVGQIEKIGLRSTRIRTGDKTLVTVPNKQMVDTVLDNWSMRTARRAEIKIDLHPHTPAAAIQQLCNFIKNLMTERDPLITQGNVVVKDINRTGILLQAEYFTASIDLAEFDALKQDLLLLIKQQVEAAQVELMVGDGR
jgi:MscS family membrane protein